MDRIRKHVGNNKTWVFIHGSTDNIDARRDFKFLTHSSCARVYMGDMLAMQLLEHRNLIKPVKLCTQKFQKSSKKDRSVIGQFCDVIFYMLKCLIFTYFLFFKDIFACIFLSVLKVLDMLSLLMTNKNILFQLCSICMYCLSRRQTSRQFCNTFLWVINLSFRGINRETRNHCECKNHGRTVHSSATNNILLSRVFVHFASKTVREMNVFIYFDKW